MASALDTKHLVVAATFALMFLLATVAVAYLTRSTLAVAAVIGGLPISFVAMGMVHARLQRGDAILILEQPKRAKPRAKRGRPSS